MNPPALFLIEEGVTYEGGSTKRVILDEAEAIRIEEVEKARTDRSYYKSAYCWRWSENAGEYIRDDTWGPRAPNPTVSS